MKILKALTQNQNQRTEEPESRTRMDQVPVWLWRKRPSLTTIHLQHNLITSLSEMSRLRSFISLSQLSLSGSPAPLLPHSRLFLLHHVRSLDWLQDLSVTREERGYAQQGASRDRAHLLDLDLDQGSDQQLVAEHPAPEGTRTHQQASRMSRKQSELEGRLDDMLSRIAMETQEIKELEQQLTDGQILVNECLQRDLEGIIRGLQDYLRGLRDQARHSQQQLLILKEENQSLQSHMDETRTHLDQMTALLMDPQEGQSGPEELDQDQSRPARPEDLLARSLEQLHRVVQQTRTRTSRQPLHQDQDLVARLQAQVAQDQDHIAQLEAQVAQDQDHIAQLEAQVAQDQDHIAQLEAQVAQDQDHIAQLEAQVAQDQDHIAQLEAQVAQERDTLRHQSDEHQRVVGSLRRKLQRSRRSDQLTDQLTADQLRDTCDQLRALNQLLQEEEEEVTLEEAQRHKADRTRTRDPGLSAPSLVSVGTWDSGLSSPDQTPRGRTPPVSDGVDGPTWLTCNQHRHMTHRCVCECVLRAAERLEEEKKRVRHTLRQHRHVLQVCDQVECVERTLLKRRAELREADRRLLEAKRHTHTRRQQQHQRDEDLRLITVKTELNTHRAELKLLLQEVLRQQQLLQDIENKRTQSQQEVGRKQEELDRKQEMLDRKQEELDRKQEELDRKQEELDRKQEERSRLQQQCKHLENRRRHADRTLSELHDDITRKRAEHDQALLLKQEVVRELAATEEQLNEKAELLCLVSERVEEQQRRLQNLDGDGEAAGDESSSSSKTS